MGRIIEEQRNLWGAQGQEVEPQRADLWVVDFRQAITGLNQQIATLESSDLEKLADTLEPFYATSVNLPVLATRAEDVNRDSRTYKMPGADEPLGEIKIVFLFDTTTNAKRSKVYALLETWRAFIRAGRGAMGNEASVTQLNEHFRIDYAFDIGLTLLRGSSNPTVNFSNQVSNVGNPSASPQFVIDAGVTNDLEQTAIYLLENAWLGSYRITDLDYSRGNELVKIEATFYAENILNEPIA